MALFLVYYNDLKIYSYSVVIDLYKTYSNYHRFYNYIFEYYHRYKSLEQTQISISLCYFFENRTSPSEFVIPLAKYYKAVYNNQISLGMWFQMMFETKEPGTRMHMSTITGISDLNGVRWKNSQWHNLQVCWHEATAGKRHDRVSIWEIEPIITLFHSYIPPF
ncbi:putative auxin response factor domain-containing protein [Helianthus annuus]|nr:putative auxin response factor domain-containing protein [Helianthus annuus]